MYLLWTALNGVVLICFVASCIYALSAIWQRLGLGSLFVFVLGLGLYAWATSAHKPVANAHTPPHEAALAIHAGVPIRLYVAIENHYLNELTLATSCWGCSDTTERLPSHVYFTGFQLGNTWHCQRATVKVKGKCLAYSVNGTMDWHLLGVMLYKEPKHLHGLVPIKEAS